MMKMLFVIINVELCKPIDIHYEESYVWLVNQITLRLRYNKYCNYVFIM